MGLSGHAGLLILFDILQNRSSRPNRSGPIDHDVFEGLPVRRWSRQATTFSQEPKPAEEETSIVDPQGLPELPMPRDSHLLTPVSRALLRAARAGCTYIRPVRKDPEPEEIEQKDDDDTLTGPPVVERTFTATKWTMVPRTIELPEVEFLAPRRAGLPSLYGAGAQSNGATAAGSSTPMRKTKFKKIDPTTGTISIYEAWVPDGYEVEGEIVQEAQVIAANPDAKVVNVDPAPGTMVADIGVVNQEGVVVASTEGSAVVPKQNKAKRKLKGGKSKSRKKVMFAPGNGTGQPVAPGAEASGDAAVQSAVSGNDATTSGTDHAAEDEEEEDDDEEGDESDEEDETTPNSKPTPMSDGLGDRNSTTPAVDTPLGSQNMLQQSPSGGQESTVQTSTEPPQGPSSSPEAPLATTSISKHSSKSPAEGPTEATISTEASDTAVLSTVSQQGGTADQPPATTVNDAKTASPIVPIPESLDVKTDAAEGANGVSPGKVVSPQTSAKEEQVSQPDLPPGSEAEARSQSPPVAHTSDPMPGPISEPPPNPSRPSSNEPAEAQTATTSLPPPETTENKPQPTSTGAVHFEDGEVDLLGSLEASLDKNPGSTKQSKPEDTPARTTEQKGDDTNAHSEIPSAKDGESNNDGKDVEMTG
ncbi:hypothetical protein MferCBS31731_002356 [Microsporum ferrugineum]